MKVKTSFDSRIPLGGSAAYDLMRGFIKRPLPPRGRTRNCGYRRKSEFMAYVKKGGNGGARRGAGNKKGNHWPSTLAKLEPESGSASS